MPIDTVIVGDERGCSVFRCGNDSRNACFSKGFIEAVALVFAQDRNRSSGTSRSLFLDMATTCNAQCNSCMSSYLINGECNFNIPPKFKDYQELSITL